MASRQSVDDRRLRPPPLQTSIQRPSTAPHSGTPTSNRHQTPPLQLDGTPEETRPTEAATKSGHQRFVLTDPVAFRYLEEDPSTTVLARREELPGYECYIVEQWTTSRTHPTFVITTYTGDPSHVAVVGVLSLPTDQTTWSPRLRVYFKALNQYHARRRETPLGILMVTSLSGFPSSLTVIPVPDGDLRKHRFDFFVNENLKRLGCSGRLGLTLARPSGSTVAKFHQLYRTSDKNDIYHSVIELVKLCQSALMLFDKLQIDYADGLLCDVTESAINDWWVEIGSEQYNVEPHDGILGPTTVAGLLGLLMGARNRLHAVGAPVAKDAFDVEAMKRGISHFQKQQRMTRTRRLDRRTLERLQKSTQKAADHEGWTVPKVLKSTAAELSGKGGEMVLDAVGRRDRAGIAEIETCDMERFVQLLYGDRCKWLWLGKQPKKLSRDHPQHKTQGDEEHDMKRGLTFKQDDQGGFTWTARKSTVDGMPTSRLPNTTASPVAQDEEDESEEEPRVKNGVLKRASGFKNEAMTGLGKFKGAVGLRTHHQQKPSAEESPTTPVDDGTKLRRPFFGRSITSPEDSPTAPNSPLAKTDSTTTDQRKRIPTDPEHFRDSVNYATSPSNGPEVSKEGLDRHSYAPDEHPEDGEPEQRAGSDHASEDQSVTETAEPSIAGSIYNDVELNEVLPIGPETEKDVNHLLRRTLSLSHFVNVQLEHRPDESYPRHLSFSLAEESVLSWDSVLEDDSGAYYDDAAAQLADEEIRAKDAKHLGIAIRELSTGTADWTQTKLHLLDDLMQQADRDQATLDSMYGRHHERVGDLQTHGEGVLRDQRERLEEGGKELETLAAKLEYVINELKGRVEDVEAGVSDFEKGVRRVEDRVAELEKQGEKGAGWGCVVS